MTRACQEDRNEGLGFHCSLFRFSKENVNELNMENMKRGKSKIKSNILISSTLDGDIISRYEEVQSGV